MKAEHPASRLLSPKPLPHDLSPQSAPCPKLGYLLEEIVVTNEEKGESGSEVVYVETSVNGCLNIGDAIG